MTSNYFSVKEILSESVRLLGLEGKFNLSDDKDADTAFFVALLSMISTGIAYKLPLKTTEDVTSDASGRLQFSQFSKPYVKYTKVLSEGQTVKVVPRTTYLLGVPNTKYEVTYAYSPAALSLDGELPFAASDCSRNVFVYALCSEYCFVEGMTDEAKRFRTSYAQEFYDTVPKRSTYLSSREWL